MFFETVGKVIRTGKGKEFGDLFDGSIVVFQHALCKAQFASEQELIRSHIITLFKFADDLRFGQKKLFAERIERNGRSME